MERASPLVYMMVLRINGAPKTQPHHTSRRLSRSNEGESYKARYKGNERRTQNPAGSQEADAGVAHYNWAEIIIHQVAGTIAAGAVALDPRAAARAAGDRSEGGRPLQNSHGGRLHAVAWIPAVVVG